MENVQQPGPQLTIEGKRAFLEQALSVIYERDELMSRYLKFLCISVEFLKSSRFHRFQIYRLILANWKEHTVEMAMIPFEYDRQQFKDCPPKMFKLGEEQALSLVNFLKPQFLDLRFNSSFHLQDKGEREFFKTIIGWSKDGLSIVLNQGLFTIVRLLDLNSSKIRELEFNAARIPEQLILPSLNLEYARFINVKSVEHLKTILTRMTVKKLRVSFDIDGDEDEATFFTNFPDEIINESVQELELCVGGKSSLWSLLRLVQRAQKLFPRLKRLSVESWIERWLTATNTDYAAQTLVEVYSQIQLIILECTKLTIPVQSKFEFCFFAEEQNPEWLAKLKADNQFKEAKLKFDECEDGLVTVVKTEQALSNSTCTLKFTFEEYDE